jgi:hypothetical protein
MTRTAVGGIAAGAFLLGVLVAMLIPGSLARWEHDRMLGGMAGMHPKSGMHPMAGHSMRGTQSMPMMGTGMQPMPMHGTGWQGMMR